MPLKLWTVVVLFLIFVVKDSFASQQCETNGFPVKRVAHAGGGVAGRTYTNSYDALNTNVEKGFVYFELDFSFTKDDKLVCLHDWHDSFKRTFGREPSGKVTLEEFEKLAATESKFKNCTLLGLKSWMVEHPFMSIVTDIKQDNLRALEHIARILPDANRRVIPQIYKPQNYIKVKELGFEKVIWTLYRFQGTDEDVVSWVDRFDGPIAVTMPKYKAEAYLPEELCQRGIPTYVHTINKEHVRKRYMDTKHVSEIYTDFLAPVD